MQVDYIFDSHGNPVYVNPKDRKGVFIEVNYDVNAIINQPYPSVGVRNLDFAREDVKPIFLRASNANTGISYAPRFDISLNGGKYNVPLMVDFTDGFMRSPDGIQLAIKLYMGQEWFNEAIQGFTFEALALNPNGTYSASIQNKLLSTSSATKVFYIPYVISTIPNYQNMIMGLMAIIGLYTQLYKVVNSDIPHFLAEVGNPFSTIGGIIGVVGYVIYLTLLFASLIAMIEAFAFAVVQPVKYHGAMLLADLLAISCEQLGLGLQIDPSITDNFPFYQVALLPEKYQIPPLNGNLSFFSSLFNIDVKINGWDEPTPDEQNGYPLMTAGEVIETCKKLVNGKVIIQEINGKPTLILARRDVKYTTPNGTYILPDVREDWNGYNTKERFGTTEIRFTKDLNDKNVIDKFQGTILQATLSLNSAPDPLLNCLKGLRVIDIGAARGIRKNAKQFSDLAVGEQIVNVMQDTFIIFYDLVYPALLAVALAVNGILSVVRDIVKALSFFDIISNSTEERLLEQLKDIDIPKFKTSFSNFGLDRDGCLLLENDMISEKKLILVDTSNPTYVNGQRVLKIHDDNDIVINAGNLFNNFYAIDMWTPVPKKSNIPTFYRQYSGGGYTFQPPNKDVGKHNQFTLWSPSNNSPNDKNKVLLSFNEFMQLATCNYFENSNGEELIMDSLPWYLEDGFCLPQYRKNEIYDQNLSLTITLPDGN